VIGNPGQADYAAANAFMDSYAKYRNSMVKKNERYGKTLSINWPLWKDGGMHVDKETEKVMMQRIGMTAMKTETGILAFYMGLASGKEQVIVAEGDVKKLRDAFLLNISNMVSTTLVDNKELVIQMEKKKNIPVIEQDLLREKVLNYFKKLLSSIIRLPVSKLEADVPMEKYGIDSVMIMQMTDQLEKVFGSLPKTLFFEYQDIGALTDYFLKTHRRELAELLVVKEKDKEVVGNIKDSTLISELAKPTFGNRRQKRFAALQGVSQKENLDIAIIGVSGRYPQSGDINKFWENLKEGKDCITEIPRYRWDHSLYFNEDKNKEGKTYSKWGGFIDDVDKFDPLFFNISPKEAELMDPQERLFLECVYHTIEDAGYTPETLGKLQDFGINGNVGVYVGVMYEEYQLYGAEEQARGKLVALPGNTATIANRISYFCNFHGPSMAVNTMCSSSLTAIYLACQSLQSGGCKIAIAGGVNISIHPNKYLVLGQGNFVSSSGKCESFGEGSDGYVPGEGVGAVLLKPLSKAIEDRDHIYGVIKATVINHGGKTNGYTVPNPNAQASVIGNALKEAKIDPRTISYVEAHGTGTSLGDPIEIAGLSKAFQEYTMNKQFCTIGSVKSNIGHCESAAGIAGITKVLLQLKHGQLVPSLHSKILNSNIDFIDSPFVVQQKLAEWKRPLISGIEMPRRAGISSFGAGGSNAHVVIEEYEPIIREQPRNIKSYNKPVIMVLSARDEKRLRERAQQLLTAIVNGWYSDADLVDMAYTLQVGREAMEERLALIVGSINDLEEKLKDFLESKDVVEGLFIGKIKHNKEILSAFVMDEDMTKVIDSWAEKGKYAKLSDIWVKGLPFDWNILYNEIKPYRISLPPYPFAKERYWVPKTGTKLEGCITRYNTAYSDHWKNNERLILIKDWHPKQEKVRKSIKTGVIVILGTAATKQLSNELFANMPRIQVVQVIHGEDISSSMITSDYYSAAAGEDLYQKVKDRQGDGILLGIIDITAYDNIYEQSVKVEAGKIIFLQKLIENDRSEGYKLLQVVTGLNAFQLKKTTMQGARLAGLYRMLSTEYKQIQSMSMDSDCKIEEYIKLTEDIQAEFLNGNEENITECCYRNNIRYEPLLKICLRNEDIKEQQFISQKYGQHEVILITGGSRGIGAAIAEYVVSQGVKNIVIMGREKLPEPSQWKGILKTGKKPEIEEKLRRMQTFIEKGVRVHYYSTPLTDQKGLNAMVENVHQNLSPITGVFHCAGQASKNPAFFKKLLSDIEGVCEPKIEGLVALDRSLAKEPLNFFILFSSISSIVPTLATGQGDYAMANSYMDYYAQNRACRGKSCFKSVLWPAWEETGMTAGVQTPAFIKTGIIPLTNADGFKFLDIIKRIPQVVSLPCVIVPEMFSYKQLLKKELIEVVQGSGPELSDSQKLSYEATLEEGSPVGSRMHIVRWLRKIFISELKLTIEQLDEDKPFDEYGIDSIMVVQMVQTIKTRISKTIDPALLFEYNTITSLVDYFIENHAEDFKADIRTKVSHTTKTINENLNQVKRKSIDSRAYSKGLLKINGKTAELEDDIAVVGISCRFPGSPTKEAYWNLLTSGISAIRPVPKKRWFPKDNRVDYGGWIDDIDLFASKFFNITDEDAAIMDPQARIIMEESLKAIYDAGYEHKQLSGGKIGVYIGGRLQPKMSMNAALQAPNPVLGIGQNYLANNISRFFNFHGPSIVVDTACSSGITGILFASDSLRSKRIDMALVGAASVLLSPFVHDMFNARNILNKDGRVHIFDKKSSGEVPGEGTGVVMLKRLKDALNDGNHIYGVIKAVSINNDGRTLGPGSPNMDAQKQVIKEALTLCKKKAEDIGYIEVNGGGSPVVDSVEIKALSDIYMFGKNVPRPCFIGSVKPNVGHLLLASGLAGFIRCVLSVYNKQIPPFLSALDPFEYYDFSASSICFNRETVPWDIESGRKRVAAQNSFPDGGSNCHILVEEFIPDERYQQRYFPKAIPDIEKKHFFIPWETVSKSVRDSEIGVLFAKHKNQGLPVKTFWGEYDEKDI